MFRIHDPEVTPDAPGGPLPPIGTLVSATREQRVLIVTGMIAGFVGLALGLAHGGFS